MTRNLIAKGVEGEKPCQKVYHFQWIGPSAYKRKYLHKKSKKKEILTGEEIVPVTYGCYAVGADNSITEKTTTVSARKIRLRDIQEKLLSKHEGKF